MLIRWILILFFFFPALCFSETAKPLEPLTLTTTDFLDTGIMASIYSCTGKDISPSFSWDHIPDKTQSFAFIVYDESIKEKFYHWLAYNIPKTIKRLEEGKDLPKGAITLKNSFGKNQYNGPCPPLGQSHSYVFTLYALDTTLESKSILDGNQLEEAMQKHILAKSSIRGVFSRWYR